MRTNDLTRFVQNLPKIKIKIICLIIQHSNQGLEFEKLVTHPSQRDVSDTYPKMGVSSQWRVNSLGLSVKASVAAVGGRLNYTLRFGGSFSRVSHGSVSSVVVVQLAVVCLFSNLCSGKM